ncbi:hypothetical protein [Achromobacter kerstersii]|uniref:hypothetical protein n=1 Tax=Achromobacter kerstersii TaxID=1353890 RepID=UPI003D07439F
MSKSKRERPPQDPAAIMQFAKFFMAAEDHLRNYTDPQTMQPPREFVAPAAVLGAFTCELMLKCIITLEGRPFAAEHNLYDLFSAISEPRRRRLIELWNEQGRPSLENLPPELKHLPVDLEPALKHCGGTFQLMRYGFEGKFQAWYLSYLPQVLRYAIAEMTGRLLDAQGRPTGPPR